MEYSLCEVRLSELTIGQLLSILFGVNSYVDIFASHARLPPSSLNGLLQP